MIRIRQVDHIVLRTTDVAAMVQFYSVVLGCPVERELPAETGLTQLRAGDSLIDLVDVESELGRAGGGPPTADRRNLDHFCLQVDNLDTGGLRDWLARHGIADIEFQVRYGAEGFGPSVYIRDPEGNTVELRPRPAPDAGP